MRIMVDIPDYMFGRLLDDAEVDKSSVEAEIISALFNVLA